MEGAANALEFARRAESAVLATLWPIAATVPANLETVRAAFGVSILFETEVVLAPNAGPAVCTAIYDGEEWLESNCWYGESPLPSGKPIGALPGAQWKSALTFPSGASEHTMRVIEPPTLLMTTNPVAVSHEKMIPSGNPRSTQPSVGNVIAA